MTTIFMTAYNSEISVDASTIHSILTQYCDKYSCHSVDKNELTATILKSLPKSMLVYDIKNYIADYCVSKSSFHPEYKRLASVICMDNLASVTDTDYRTVITNLRNNLNKNGETAPIVSEELYDIVMKHSNVIQHKLNFDRDYDLDYFGLKTLERSYLAKLRYIVNPKYSASDEAIEEYNKNVMNLRYEKELAKNMGIYVEESDNDFVADTDEYDDDGHTGIYRLKKIRNKKLVRMNKIVERPQHMWMRVALGIHGYNLKDAFETYDLLSLRMMIMATPCLFNAGTPCPQLSSCFLFNCEDSVDGMYLHSLTDMARVSKFSGGLGICLSDIRATGTLIKGSNGTSHGIIPYCSVIDKMTAHIDQGGKRRGSCACYLEVWHSDIYSFVDLRKNTGDSEKTRDLFIALWVCDLFMKRVEENGMWSLLCPHECPNLTSTYGAEFEKLYLKYETEKRYKKQVKAVDLFYHIMTAQIETGMPYILYKDHCNKKSNQSSLGTIKCSNLCAEIIEYTDNETTAVCNLASLCLPKYIENGTFNFNKLGDVTRVLVRNLNKVIDVNFYPTERTKSSNMNHRPTAIGIQGLADVYNIMKYPFDSEQAELLNKQIFETIYFNAQYESNKSAIKHGAYSSFNGSPSSKGLFQFDLWNLDKNKLTMNFDWDSLRESIIQHGLRNSLTTAVMPTASTASIMGNSECIEPILSNIFVRSTLAGEFVIINENLINTLIDLKIWNDDMRKKIIICNGSVQKIKEIPQDVRNVYKTAFELKQKAIIKQSFERGPFIDQSQSLNLFMDQANFDKLASMHFYGWHNGLKTGLYYLRSHSAVDPMQFGIDLKEINQLKSELETNNDKTMCKWRPGMKISECQSCS